MLDDPSWHLMSRSDRRRDQFRVEVDQGRVLCGVAESGAIAQARDGHRAYLDLLKGDCTRLLI